LNRSPLWEWRDGLGLECDLALHNTFTFYCVQRSYQFVTAGVWWMARASSIGSVGQRPAVTLPVHVISYWQKSDVFV
jgi:hypothetical protein